MTQQSAAWFQQALTGLAKTTRKDQIGASELKGRSEQQNGSLISLSKTTLTNYSLQASLLFLSFTRSQALDG